MFGYDFLGCVGHLQLAGIQLPIPGRLQNISNFSRGEYISLGYMIRNLKANTSRHRSNVVPSHIDFPLRTAV